jgi:hypothetical protein
MDLGRTCQASRIDAEKSADGWCRVVPAVNFVTHRQESRSKQPPQSVNENHAAAR